MSSYDIRQWNYGLFRFFLGGRELHIWKVQHLPLVSNVSVLLSLAQSLPES